LTELPSIPDNVTKLTCYGNQLTTLPKLPAGLIELRCQTNQLTALPDLPAGLTGLWCSNNRLTALPDLPAGLTRLSCYDNQLTALPDLPAGLTNLLCFGNLFPPALQAILDEYEQDFAQLIISVNYYNAEQRRRKNIRQTGRTYRNLAFSGPYEYTNVLSHIGHMATGHKPTGNLQKTLRNLKRNHNSYGPRQQRKSKQRTRKSRKHK